MPRHFQINDEGSLMFVTTQDGNSLELFAIDEGTGKLTTKETTESGNSPTFVGILN